MNSRRLVYSLIFLPLLLAAIQSCNNDRGTDYDRTDLKQITDLIQVDPQGKTAFPDVWIDTISRLDQYDKATAGLASINPLDFWVELASYGCTVTIVDSCAPDEFNEGDSCGEIELETGARAETYVVNILDTLVCRYHIVERADSSVTVKTVKYKEIQTAVAAKLEKNEVQYGGWRLFAVGRQRLGFGYSASSFPAIDSIILESRSRDEIRKAYYPNQAIRYDIFSKLPEFYAGEPLRVTAYTRSRFSNPPIEDAYVHYAISGKVYHEWMGTDISNDSRYQIFEWDIYESSGAASNTYSQIAVELFQGASLRDTNPNQFANMIWAMTYRVE